jgi:glycosyltransferase involved in cell wall biosynthesis
MNCNSSIDLSVVIPVYNEEEVLPTLGARLTSSLAALGRISYEIIFVNDGSTDRSGAILHEWCNRDARVVLVSLSRNFGHQAAITAGLYIARGRCAVVMDADLQDPPELISELVERWRQGYQVVIAERRSRAEKGLRRLLFAAFYRVLRALSDYPLEVQSGVFGLMDRKVFQRLVEMPERSRFMPGMRSWLGFRQCSVLYDRADRSAGYPKQTFGRLLHYGLDAIFSFSYKPLRLILAVGSIISVFCFIYGAVLVLMRILHINVVRGFTTPTVSILFLGGIQLIAIGVLGQYLARIYDEIKGRPLFVVDEMVRREIAPDLDADLNLG